MADQKQSRVDACRELNEHLEIDPRRSHSMRLLCIPPNEKSLKGKRFAAMEEVKEKTTET
jgi:hypothetical protein